MATKQEWDAVIAELQAIEDWDRKEAERIKAQYAAKQIIATQLYFKLVTLPFKEALEEIIKVLPDVSD
jgi:hypothetical protein